MPVLPGAEPFFHSGGSTGVLLCHGFTGTPGTLRPWADYLAEAGLAVSLPRLPGHGTTWQEMARTRWEDWYAEIDRAYSELRGHVTEIFAMRSEERRVGKECRARGAPYASRENQ